MADPQYNSLYTDLGYTHYPALIDKRTGDATATDAPNSFLVRNYDYVPGQPAVDDNYVKAEDIAAIQDAVIAIQRVLGHNPQVSYSLAATEEDTVAYRIATMENNVSGLDPDALDLKYGGTGYAALVTKPSILSHQHLGTAGNPSKINLTAATSEVTGQLPAANILTAGAGSLTGSNLRVASVSAAGDTIEARFANTFDKTIDNTVSGKTTFTNNVNSNTVVEFDCSGMTNVTDTTDADAWSGTAGVIAGADTLTASAQFKLRYGFYGLKIRAKASSNTNESTVLNVIISGSVSTGSAVTYGTYTITGTEFDAADTYQEFYMYFNHKNIPNGNKYVTIEFDPTGTSRPSISFDSIIILPANVGVWSK